jgi:hypothetical protein
VRLENPNGQLSVNLLALWRFVPPVMSLWPPTPFEPKNLGTLSTRGPKARRSMPYGPLERTRRSSGTAEFALPANQQNWSRLGFSISTFSTAAANLLELANGCSVQKTRPRYGSGAGSPLTCQLLHDDPIKVSSINWRRPCGSSSHRPHEHRSLQSTLSTLGDTHD